MRRRALSTPMCLSPPPAGVIAVAHERLVAPSAVYATHILDASEPPEELGRQVIRLAPEAMGEGAIVLPA